LQKEILGWSIDDSSPDFNNMKKTSFALQKSDFYNDRTYFTLDLPTYTFKVENNDNQTVAEVSDIQDKKLIPFVIIFETSTKVSLVK